MPSIADYFSPQITRFPVAGPAPFNTLYVFDVWFSANEGDKWGETDNYFLYKPRVYSPLVLKGFDPSNPPDTPPPFQHSSFVQFIDPGPAKNDNFLFAVNEISGAGFDMSSGTFYLDITTAVQLPDNSIPQTEQFAVGFFDGYVITAAYRLTSFVLVNEPQDSQDSSDNDRSVRREWTWRRRSPLWLEGESRAKRSYRIGEQKKWKSVAPFLDRYDRC